MQVKVKAFANFREAIGKREIEIELDSDSSVRDLLEELCKRYDLSDLLFEEGGALQKYIKILVNGEDVVFLKGLETKLKSGDEIALFPPVAGG
jgi:molybdopterin synthase sulfur carrier subunit